MFIAIVPAYNEEKHIGEVVRALSNHVDQVIVVDDGSKDNTVSMAKRLGAFVLQHHINRGQGAALETGHAYARKINASYVLHFDGDGQFDVKDIRPALLSLKKSNADILFGTRFHENSGNVPFLKKYLLLPTAKLIERLNGSLQLSDAHNGFRIISRKGLDKIFITQDKMAHATEIPMLVKKHELKYVEHPITVRYHEYGQGVRGGIAIVKDLLFGRFIS